MNRRDFEIATAEAETDLAVLKARYDQWIQGMERVPPVRARDALDRRLRELRRNQPNNTAARFKFNSIYARWTTLSTYWARVSRQIEEGTFRRDVMKVRDRRNRRQEPVAAKAAPEPALELDFGAGGFDFDAEIGAALDALEVPKATPAAAKPAPASAAAKPVAPKAPAARSPAAAKPPPPPAAKPPPPPPGARRPPPPPGRAPAPGTKRAGLSDGDMRRVFDRYVAARKSNAERVDNVSFEKLKKRIQKMEPELRKKHGGKRIDFEVVVKNGRVGLKPIAKK
ncbi:MAG: MXAN_5187 C-terminal domain-containing protein [Myxococcota bacterium]